VLRALSCLLALVLLAGCGGDDEASAQDVELADTLKEGGVVLVMRHAITEPATDRVEEVGDCSTQRNLTDEGREQARQIGRDMDALGIPVDKVLTSPLCRAKETAELAFGDAQVRMWLLSASEEATPADERRIRRLEDATTAPAGSATALVTHTGNIGGAFDQSVGEGDILVVRGDEQLGIVKPEDWERLADAAESE
jgi:phosphohistidine phosphatase SixA